MQQSVTIEAQLLQALNTTARQQILDGLFKEPHASLREKQILFNSLFANNTIRDAPLPSTSDIQNLMALITSFQSKIYHEETEAWVLLGICGFSFLLLVFLLGFIAVIHQQNKTASFSNSATPFNVLCVLGILCNALFSFLEGTQILNPNAALNICARILESFWAITYLIFSWIRAEKQILSVFPSSFRAIRICICLAPCVLLLPPCVSIWSVVSKNEDDRVETALGWLQVVAASCFITLDALFLRCFSSYLAHTQVDEDSPIDTRFLIISRYGCVASSLCLLMFLFALFHAIDPQRWWFLGIASACVAPLVFFTLVLMKVALHVQAARELEAARARMRRAKEECDATLFALGGGGNLGGGCIVGSRFGGSTTDALWTLPKPDAFHA
ncbi:hypothetical protein BC830DRAFT_1122356 [Chytriomyces sp. MP71]|nr:hypothetical protein BC830DRAFT_1122356 [Chytriomyces sp. MP71]